MPSRNQRSHTSHATDFLFDFKSDMFASVVVFLVALPLCMGIAIASGAPVSLGLITGIVGGIVVGILSGAPLQVSGPAAGLSVIVFQMIGDYGLESLGWAVLVAGALQLVAGVLRLGQWFRAVSPAVIHGMLAGIGALIVASQFHVMVDDVPKTDGLQNLLAIPLSFQKCLTWPALVSVLTIVVLLLWRLALPKRWRLIPAPLAAIAVATFVTTMWQLPVQRVAVPDNLWSEISMPSLSSSQILSWMGILKMGAVIAVVASAETLLCATALDKIHHGPRTDYDRELGAQGIGNIVCGLLGSLPMTGVIVRSAANVEAGGRSRVAAILHGCWLLVFVWFLADGLRLIPTAGLAAILVYTGYKLINPQVVRELRKYGRGEVAIYLFTLAIIVCFDLLTGVTAGIALSAAKLLLGRTRLNTSLVIKQEDSQAVLSISGAATFLRLPHLARELEKIPPDAELCIDAERLEHIDHACLDLLMNWAKQHELKGGVSAIDWQTLTQIYRDNRQPQRPDELKSAA